jgi:hypothetical protein
LAGQQALSGEQFVLQAFFTHFLFFAQLILRQLLLLQSEALQDLAAAKDAPPKRKANNTDNINIFFI